MDLEIKDFVAWIDRHIPHTSDDTPAHQPAPQKQGDTEKPKYLCAVALPLGPAMLESAGPVALDLLAAMARLGQAYWRPAVTALLGTGAAVVLDQATDEAGFVSTADSSRPPPYEEPQIVPVTPDPAEPTPPQPPMQAPEHMPWINPNKTPVSLPN